jgi:hypothetical protein
VLDEIAEQTQRLARARHTGQRPARPFLLARAFRPELISLVENGFRFGDTVSGLLCAAEG